MFALSSNANRQTRRTTRAALAAFGLAALLGPAAAQAQSSLPPRAVELQVSMAKLGQLIEHRLTEEAFCAPGSFPLPGHDGLFVLDHISFPAGISFRRSGHQIQIVAPFRIFTKRSACIRNPNCSFTDYEPNAPIQFELLLGLDMTLHQDDEDPPHQWPWLCVAYAGLEDGGVPVDPEAMGPALAGAVQNLVGPICTHINILGPMRKMIGTTPLIKEVGVNANSSLTRLAVRLELEDPNNAGSPPHASWTQFDHGSIGPVLEGADWSMFIDARTFEKAIEDRFERPFENKEDLDILHGPGATWSGQGSAGGRVVVDMGIDYDDTPCPNSIGADPVTIAMDLSASASNPDKILTHGTLAVDIIDSDVLLCASLLGAAPGSFPGIVSTMAFLAADAGPSQDDFPNECSASADGSVFDCAQAVTLPALTLSRMGLAGTKAYLQLTRLYGDSAGPLLGGPMNIIYQYPHPPVDLLSYSTEGFSYGITGGCSTLKAGYTCEVRLSGDGELCSLQIIDDPKGMFGASVRPMMGTASGLGANANSMIVEVKFPANGDNFNAYFADGAYPCRLVVQTSVGARCIDVPPPPQPPAEGSPAFWDLSIELVEAKANCKRIVRFPPGAFLPTWNVDPPPFDLPVLIEALSPAGAQTEVEASLTDFNVELLNTLEGLEGEQGHFDFNPAQVRITGHVRIDSEMVSMLESPTKSAKAGDMSVPFEQIVTLDLHGRVEPDGQATLHLDEGIRTVVDIGENAVPAGARRLSVGIDLDLARLSLSGLLDREDPPADEPATDTDDGLPAADGVPNACGSGLCGTGMAMPLLAAAFAALLQRRGQRRVGA